MICSLLISRNIAKNNKRLCRPSFTESQQSLFRSQYRIGCDSKPANHSLAKIRTNKMALVSAIILLSNRKRDFQKVSVFKAFRPIIFTFSHSHSTVKFPLDISLFFRKQALYIEYYSINGTMRTKSRSQIFPAPCLGSMTYAASGGRTIPSSSQVDSAKW